MTNYGISTQSIFNTSTLHAKIQGLSIQVGQLFAELYAGGSSTQDEAMHCLESYKNLRRLLPRESAINGYMGDRHVGATAAHNATQKA
tara:strand:+ start:1174 stop:1437 length:264 start_codon:yes stop_codon:yes gene_type:complete